MTSNMNPQEQTPVDLLKSILEQVNNEQGKTFNELVAGHVIHTKN
jgi:hypothetical protein